MCGIFAAVIRRIWQTGPQNLEINLPWKTVVPKLWQISTLPAGTLQLSHITSASDRLFLVPRLMTSKKCHENSHPKFSAMTPTKKEATNQKRRQNIYLLAGKNDNVFKCLCVKTVHEKQN